MDLAHSTIAVTGATGCLGRYITLNLLKRGVNVRGVVRDPARRPELRRLGAEFRIADLLRSSDLLKAFTGTDAVVANAGVLNATDDAEFHRANVVGVENVLKAAARAGVKRVLLVSSVAVYQHNMRNVAEDGEQLNEGSRFIPSRAYRVSKALGEQLAWRLSEKLPLSLTVVRPGVIYGAFDSFLPMFRRLLDGPVALIPYGLRIPLVYAGDVAEAISRCVERDQTDGRIYNLTGLDRPWERLAAAWREAGGQVARFRIPVPVPIRLSYSSQKAEAELGWAQTSFIDALTETFATESAA